ADGGARVPHGSNARRAWTPLSELRAHVTCLGALTTAAGPGCALRGARFAFAGHAARAAGSRVAAHGDTGSSGSDTQGRRVPCATAVHRRIRCPAGGRHAVG